MIRLQTMLFWKPIKVRQFFTTQYINKENPSNNKQSQRKFRDVSEAY